MAGIAAGGEVRAGPPAANAGRRRAAGIYGAIITAAILDTAGDRLSTGALVAAVVIALLVYWLAEEYAELLGEQATGGKLPSRAYVREALAARAAKLRGWRLLFTVSVAVALGLVMVVLKDLVLIHLH